MGKKKALVICEKSYKEKEVLLTPRILYTKEI
jgi:hypothetical protein